jgi:hypothetical protein
VTSILKPRSLGDELRTVVDADERRRREEPHELLQHGHHILRLSPPAHPDAQKEKAMLLNHVQKLESADISRGDELEVHGPHLVGMLGTLTPR